MGNRCRYARSGFCHSGRQRILNVQVATPCGPAAPTQGKSGVRAKTALVSALTHARRRTAALIQRAPRPGGPDAHSPGNGAWKCRAIACRTSTRIYRAPQGSETPGARYAEYRSQHCNGFASLHARRLRPAPALRWQTREFSKHTAISVAVDIEGPVDSIGDLQRTCIYRVVQEALTNCARHSKAKNAHLKLRRTSEQVRLELADDGIGFGADASYCGMGLIGIEERVRELGGTVEIASGPGEGTRLSVEIPLNGNA